MLFANGQVQEALGRLDKALDQDDLEGWTLSAWLMRFDLYQHLARKAEFEEKALDFVVKFERSPPAWTDAPPALAPGGAMRPGGAAHVALSGVLGASSAAAIEQLRKAAERQNKLRVDFAKLQGIEAEGCKLLLDALRGLRKAKKEIYLSGEGQAFKLLRAQAVAGDASVDQAVWLLLLDLYQQLAMQPEFEEAAVDYAVTYEVSPPSWEAPATQKGAAAPLEPAEPVTERANDHFDAAGEIAGQQEQLFADLAAYAAQANPVVVDLTATRRVDFINAGRLLNVVEKLHQDGKPVVIRGAGQMIIALFEVMGIHKLARIIPRK